MAYVQRHSGFVAAVMLLSACGVAVEQAPQTNSAQRSADSANVITTPEPVIAAPAQQSARIDQAGTDADTDEAGGDGLIIDNIIASIESPESVPPPVPGAVTDTDPGEPVADPSADEGEAAPSGTETVLALLAPVIAESAARAQPAPQPPSSADAPANEPADESADAPADDAVEDIIWNIETAQRNKPPAAQATVPVGPDESLASDALEAAFAMISNRTPPTASQNFILPAKPLSVTRVGLLIPKTGPNSQLGEELLRGAELALFEMRDPSVELLSFDTAGGPRAEAAAREALTAGVDIVVGPLFSQSVVAARKVAGERGVPMLALSNNLQIANRSSWLLGYMPEHQIESLLGHALTAGHSKIAILAEESPFGRRLADHAVRRLRQLGMTPEVMMVLSPAQLAAEDQLKAAIRDFTGYVPLEEDEEAPAFADLPPPRFDAMVFAGGAEFALRTAPVLAYYDADSERVLYLGNAQWNQRRLLMEPSLSGALFASRPTDQDARFNTLWTDIWANRPGTLARLSFDAMAMITMVARNKPPRWRAALSSDAGFTGFSGAYRLFPDGSNRRAFELRRIEAGVSTLFQPAPDKI